MEVGVEKQPGLLGTRTLNWNDTQ